MKLQTHGFSIKGTGLMEHVNLNRLERLIHIPVHSRPDWLKNAREDAEELLWLACRASTNQDLASPLFCYGGPQPHIHSTMAIEAKASRNWL